MRLKVIKDSYLATEIFFPFVYMFLKRVYGMESIKGVTKIIHSFSNSFNMMFYLMIVSASGLWWRKLRRAESGDVLA